MCKDNSLFIMYVYIFCIFTLLDCFKTYRSPLLYSFPGDEESTQYSGIRTPLCHCVPRREVMLSTENGRRSM